MGTASQTPNESAPHRQHSSEPRKHGWFDNIARVGAVITFVIVVLTFAYTFHPLGILLPSSTPTATPTPLSPRQIMELAETAPLKAASGAVTYTASSGAMGDGIIRLTSSPQVYFLEFSVSNASAMTLMEENAAGGHFFDRSGLINLGTGLPNLGKWTKSAGSSPLNFRSLPELEVLLANATFQGRVTAVGERIGDRDAYDLTLTTSDTGGTAHRTELAVWQDTFYRPCRLTRPFAGIKRGPSLSNTLHLIRGSLSVHLLPATLCSERLQSRGDEALPAVGCVTSPESGKAPGRAE
jgi:hypothetical protein